MGMIFSELYSAYYNAVAAILKEAMKKPLPKMKMRRLIAKHAFSESVLNIEPAFDEGRWQLMKKDGSTVLRHEPTMPLTTLERQWLRAVKDDPRMRLFDKNRYDDKEEDNGAENNGSEADQPLFTDMDCIIYDRYGDGDPYADEQYIENFRIIRKAIHEKQPLLINYITQRGYKTRKLLLPEGLEYSEKDDKFRLIGTARHAEFMLNVSRIVSCEPYPLTDDGESEKDETTERRQKRKRTLVFELIDRRNALERVMMHFAHFEKEVERIEGEENRYKVTLHYDRTDETEMVIRLLSFGPMIRVTEPVHFVGLIKDRLEKQKSCEP